MVGVLAEGNSQKSLTVPSSTPATMCPPVGRNAAQLGGAAECRNSVHVEPSLSTTSHLDSKNAYGRKISFEFIVDVMNGSWRGGSSQKIAETSDVVMATNSPSRVVTSEASNVTVGPACSQTMP